MTFADLGLDPRLLRALEKREYEKPTPVQVSRFYGWKLTLCLTVTTAFDQEHGMRQNCF